MIPFEHCSIRVTLALSIFFSFLYKYGTRHTSLAVAYGSLWENNDIQFSVLGWDGEKGMCCIALALAFAFTFTCGCRSTILPTGCYGKG